MGSGTAPDVLERLRADVDAALGAALDRLLPRLTATDARLTPVAEATRDFVAAGKRIRPVLLLLGYEAAGGERHADVLGPALALELLHTFALVHDDVIDHAATRRGAPAVHRRFAAAHREAGWPGDADAYGEAVAILLGDLAFVHADELFLEAVVPAGRLLQAFGRFTRLREEVMAGQYLDLQASVERTTDRELTLTIATLKSGRYSVSRPLEIGALLAGAGPGVAGRLGAFGEPLGRAFQIRDDLLGVFGDESTTGKSTSSDLVEGKRTLLVVEALTRLTGPAHRELASGLGDQELDADGTRRLRGLLERSGAREAAERYVSEAVAQAHLALDGLDMPATTRTKLLEVADYLGARPS